MSVRTTEPFAPVLRCMYINPHNWAFCCGIRLYVCQSPQLGILLRYIIVCMSIPTTGPFAAVFDCMYVSPHSWAFCYGIQIDERRPKTLETCFLITICRPTGDKGKSKTLFLAFFYPRSSIVKSVFDCRLPGVVSLYIYRTVFYFTTHYPFFCYNFCNTLCKLNSDTHLYRQGKRFLHGKGN